MSGLVSIDTVYVAIFFLVPGYIFLTFRNQFVAGQDRLGTEQILAFITYSALNLAFFGWILFTLPRTAQGWVVVLTWVFVILIGPAILGLASGIWTQKELGSRTLRIFRLELSASYGAIVGLDFSSRAPVLYFGHAERRKPVRRVLGRECSRHSILCIFGSQGTRPVHFPGIRNSRRRPMASDAKEHIYSGG